MKSRWFVVALMVAGLTIVNAFGFSLPDTNVEIKYKSWEMLVDKDASGGISVGDEIWGLMRLTGIDALSGSALWNPAAAHEEITGKFDSIIVNSISLQPNGRFNVQLTGGEMNLFLHEPLSADPAPGNYASFLAGQQFLTTKFNYGITPNSTSITQSMDVSSLTSPIFGTGLFYLDVTGGAYADLFNSNFYEVWDGSRRDLQGQINYGGSGIQNRDDPPAVPEPSTFLLFGVGLLVIGVYSKQSGKTIMNGSN